MSNVPLRVFVYYTIKILFTVENNAAVSFDQKDYFNQSKIGQWWIEKLYQRIATTVKSPSKILPSSSTSSNVCIPFHTCSTNTNRTTLIILTSIFIVLFYFYYQCQEHSMVRTHKYVTKQ